MSEKIPYVEQVVDINSVRGALNDYHEMEAKILEFEKWSDYDNISSTFDLNMVLSNREYAGDQELNVVTVYPGADTQERVDALNDFLDDEGAKYKKDLNVNYLPEKKFTVDYIMNDFDKATTDINNIWDKINRDDYATDFEQSLGMK